MKDTFEIHDRKRGRKFVVSRQTVSVAVEIPKMKLNFTTEAHRVTDDAGFEYHWFSVSEWTWHNPPFKVPCEAVVFRGKLVGTGKPLEAVLRGVRDLVEIGA